MAGLKRSCRYRKDTFDVAKEKSSSYRAQMELQRWKKSLHQLYPVNSFNEWLCMARSARGHVCPQIEHTCKCKEKPSPLYTTLQRLASAFHTSCLGWFIAFCFAWGLLSWQVALKIRHKLTACRTVWLRGGRSRKWISAQSRCRCSIWLTSETLCWCCHRKGS